MSATSSVLLLQLLRALICSDTAVRRALPAAVTPEMTGVFGVRGDSALSETFRHFLILSSCLWAVARIWGGLRIARQKTASRPITIV